MANRVLRDWTTSEVMESLSSDGEVLFTRLIMKADDFGSYYANPKLLKAGLFPLKDISFAMIDILVRECESAGLLFRYTVDGKEYIRINNFGQRLRNMRNAFPHPQDNPQQSAASCSDTPPETETEEETETESEVEKETNISRAVENKTVPREAIDLIDALCDYFEVQKILTSKIYNSIDDFVTTVSHRNELKIVAAALKNYVAYKARSQEAKHNPLTWIGTKADHYNDGKWKEIDWQKKLRNYEQQSTKGTNRTTSAKVSGNSYGAGLLPSGSNAGGGTSGPIPGKKVEIHPD
jgi:hypothetical protein